MRYLLKLVLVIDHKILIQLLSLLQVKDDRLLILIQSLNIDIVIQFLTPDIPKLLTHFFEIHQILNRNHFKALSLLSIFLIIFLLIICLLVPILSFQFLEDFPFSKFSSVDKKKLIQDLQVLLVFVDNFRQEIVLIPGLNSH